jgi:DNA-binding MarR family transcriptional regulator
LIRRSFTYKLTFVKRDVLYLDDVAQAETLLKPQRIDVLRHLAEPCSCTEVARLLRQSQQRVYYHVRRLVDAGLVTQSPVSSPSRVLPARSPRHEQHQRKDG